MTTSPAPTSRITVLDRIADWALDPDGHTYGDERERLRWYEGMATAAMIQWIALPWAAAVLVWVGGRPVAPTLVVLLALLYLPILLCARYVARRRVDPRRIRWTTRTISTALLVGVPYLLFLFGLARAYHLLAGPPVWAVPLGAAFGIGGAAVGVRLDARRRNRAAAAEELD
ncbi:hypothetical protein [Plantactinospora soyae]|uniref:DUF2029 domain-containing protein n=1 Tax=Plantactinospora soyae TaxID=1544732 RepID=A0A927R265_9ACTN|nr:hypothetical protein [Plantactinospora soyae]MBE1490453.1 hypothetical protein [Plantactinospora soyae]